MYKLVSVIVVALIETAILSGCTSTSTGNFAPGAGHVNGATVSVSAPAGSSSALYLPKLVAVLRKHGFTVVGKGQPAEYSAELEMNAGVWNVQCTINLLQRGVPLISASNLNPGWGNWLARGASISVVADAAIREFDKKLSGY
jgi:hypothetical protein